MAAAAAAMVKGAPLTEDELKGVLSELKTRKDTAEYLLRHAGRSQ